jgi:hypothetical protein
MATSFDGLISTYAIREVGLPKRIAVFPPAQLVFVHSSAEIRIIIEMMDLVCYWKGE